MISNNNHQHTYLSTSYKTNKHHSTCLINDILETDFSTKKEENLLKNELKNKNKINYEKIKPRKTEEGKEERKPPYLLTSKVSGSWYPEPKKPEDIRIFGIVIGNQELNKVVGIRNKFRLSGIVIRVQGSGIDTGIRKRIQKCPKSPEPESPESSSVYPNITVRLSVPETLRFARRNQQPF